MKRLTVVLATLAFCFGIMVSIPLNAQTQEQTPAPGAGMEKAESVAQMLNLSPQQESQLEPILQAEAPKVKAITDDPNLSPEQKKSKLKSVHDQTDPMVKSILSPTQYKQWQIIRKSQLQNLK